MDQVKKFLAGYVEWIALTLGVAFLGWMIYSYVVYPPVTVAVGPNNPAVTPANINHIIWDQVGKQLDAATKVQTAVAVPVPQYGAEVATAMAEPTPDVASLGGSWVVDHIPPAVIDGPEVAQVKSDNAQAVTVLPVVPAATDLAMSSGHSNVPGATQTAAAIDVAWVSIGFKIPSTSGLKPAFAAAKIEPVPQLGSTTVLAVELYREEKQADGTYGGPVLVPKPIIAQVQAMPAAAVAKLGPIFTGPQVAYAKYAAEVETLILRPDFYKVEPGAGDEWYAPVPGAKNPNDKAITLMADDATPKPATPKPKPTRPAGVRAPTAAGRAPGSGGRGGGNGTGGQGGGGSGGGGGGAGRFLAADPGRPSASALSDQVAPVAPQPPVEGMAPVAPAGEPAALPPLPKAPFVPATEADFQCWAHDCTVVPGKTYRYMVKYVIASPVFNTDHRCNPQSLALQFALTSLPSAWTTPVDVASDTNFFATDVKPSGIQFDIFKWRDGGWQMQTMIASDGDPIGVADPKAGDAFVTGWTLVDVRDASQGRNRFILLASDNGTLQRELNVDQHRSDYILLRNLVLAGKPKANPGGLPAGLPGTIGPGPAGAPAGGQPGGGAQRDDRGE